MIVKNIGFVKIMGSIVSMLLFVGCQSINNNENVQKGYKQDSLKYANGFAVFVDSNKTHIQVINPWQHAKNVCYDYYLSKSNTENTHIKTPIKRVVCLSTTHLAYIHLLGEDASVVGVTNSQLISNLSIQKQIMDGNTLDIGNEQALNFELILSLKPDLIFAYSVGAEVQGYYKKFTDWGIPVVLVSEYLERTPMAKAEWLKFFGYFYNKKELADSLFKSIDEKYTNLVHSTDTVKTRPVVLSSMPWKDVWYVPGGNSYMASFIKDAGGNYLWQADTSVESLSLSIESVFFKAMNADIWINTGMAETLLDIQKSDPRMVALKPFINKMVFNNNKMSNIDRGNDFWESGVVNPHLILSDLINIFHPEISADSNLYYYKKLY